MLASSVGRVSVSMLNLPEMCPRPALGRPMPAAARKNIGRMIGEPEGNLTEPSPNLTAAACI